MQRELAQAATAATMEFRNDCASAEKPSRFATAGMPSDSESADASLSDFAIAEC